MKKLIALLPLILALPVLAQPAVYLSPNNPPVGVTLAWDAPADGSVVTGYLLYYGTDGSGLYTVKKDVGNVQEFSMSGLKRGLKYFFAVTATNAFTVLESPFSNEVVYMPPPPPGPPANNHIVENAVISPKAMALAPAAQMKKTKKLKRK